MKYITIGRKHKLRMRKSTFMAIKYLLIIAGLTLTTVLFLGAAAKSGHPSAGLAMAGELSLAALSLGLIIALICKERENG